MTETDEALMAAYQLGDASAFERLLARHEKPIWRFLRRFVGDRALAEDLMQEVFLRVIRSAADWKAEARFTTWLYAIARNLCADQARRALHRHAGSLDAPLGGDRGGPTLHDALPSDRAAPDQAVMDTELGVRIDRAVSSLPVDQREVFLMREVLDLPFAEIARAVGASEPTVKSRMRYALEKLREALTDYRDVASRAEAR